MTAPEYPEPLLMTPIMQVSNGPQDMFIHIVMCVPFLSLFEGNFGDRTSEFAGESATSRSTLAH